MKITALMVLASLPISIYASATNVNLGTAASFGVLAGSTVTNTGPTVIDGNVGVSAGSAITGFPPGMVTAPATEYAGDAVAAQAQSDLTQAYIYAAGEPCGDTLTGEDLGGMILTPGVYCFASSAQLTGLLTLNAEGDSDAVFVIQIESALTTASNSAVAFINDGQGASVYWQIGTSATLGTGTAFAGNLLASASVTLNTDANISCGSALAQTGAVTLDSNAISIETAACDSGPITVAHTSYSPEPSTAFLLLLIGLPFVLWRGFRGASHGPAALLRRFLTKLGYFREAICRPNLKVV